MEDPDPYSYKKLSGLESCFFAVGFIGPGIVGVGAADQQLVSLCLGEDPDVVVAVVLALPLHQAQLSVPLTRVPRDSLLKILLCIYIKDYFFIYQKQNLNNDELRKPAEKTYVKIAKTEAVATVSSPC